MDLKYSLKRGGLLAAANWPAAAIQFAAQTTFQLLIAVPIVGAAILVAWRLLGADLNNLLQGTTRQIFTTIAATLTSEPVALTAFVASFAIMLVGGSILMFLAKGAPSTSCWPPTPRPDRSNASHSRWRPSARPGASPCRATQRAAAGLFRRYLVLGITLMLIYALSGAASLAFIVYGYQPIGDSLVFVGWALIAAMTGIALVFWITAVNVTHLFLQIAVAAEDLR